MPLSDRALLGRILSRSNQLQDAFNEDFNNDVPLVELIGQFNYYIRDLKGMSNRIHKNEVRRELTRLLENGTWNVNLMGERVLADRRLPEDKYSDIVNQLFDEVTSYVRNPGHPV
jgi:hypothetical protein